MLFRDNTYKAITMLMARDTGVGRLGRLDMTGL